MLLDLPNGNLPALDRVALFAVCSHLSAVNVGVAVLAALAHICEDRLDVTLGAGHRLVHPAQRIFRLVVIELRNRTDWPPRIGGVAVLARNGQVSVRTMCTAGFLRERFSRDSGRR